MSVQSPHVLLLVGSMEQTSRVRVVLDVLEQALNDLGVTTYLWDLACEPLPLFDPRYYMTPAKHPCEAVRTFVELAGQAQAFVWGTPVYHNSFSGVLKNALDMLSKHQLCNKPVALVSGGSNDRTASQSSDHLQAVARSCHAIAIPRQIVALSSDFSRVPGGYQLKDEQLRERAVLLASELVAYAEALRNLQLRETDTLPLVQNITLVAQAHHVSGEC